MEWLPRVKGSSYIGMSPGKNPRKLSRCVDPVWHLQVPGDVMMARECHGNGGAVVLTRDGKTTAGDSSKTYFLHCIFFVRGIIPLFPFTFNAFPEISPCQKPRVVGNEGTLCQKQCLLLFSYKLWYNYLKLRRSQVIGRCITDPAYEDVNNAFERSIVFMHKVKIQNVPKLNQK